jgi:hypothetical protein
MKRLFIDIETAPNVVFSWRTGWKISIDAQNIIEERAIICICYKWEHEKIVKFLTWDAQQSDKRMIQSVLKTLESADEIVGQNIERFDIPWIRTRALYHGLSPDPYYKTIDILQFAKRNLYLNSNKLDYVGQYLGFGGKLKTDFNLWKEIVLNNNKKSLATMIKYCKRDVVLTENVYHKFSDSMAIHTHAGVLDGNEKWTCPRCSSSAVCLNKTRVTALGTVKRQFICRKCGRVYSISDKSYQDYKKVKEDDKKNQIKLKESL